MDLERAAQRAVLIFAVGASLLGATALSPNAHPAKTSSANPADSAAAFLGRWDLTLKAPDREYPSWLELTQEKGQLKAVYVGRWGNARPLPKAEITNGRLKFVSPREEEGRNDDMVFEATLSGNRLSGTTTGPDGNVGP